MSRQISGGPELRNQAALAAVGVTVPVYGLVAVLVKLDDLGLRLRRAGAGGRGYGVGTALLRGTPWVMKALSVVDTAAMFLVGGGILAHGTPPLEHLLHGPRGVARTAPAAAGVP